VIEDPTRLPLAPDRAPVLVNATGYIGEMNAEAVGVAAMKLGAGRERAEDAVDHGVGVIVKKKPGEAVKPGDAVFEVYHRDGRGLPPALALLGTAFTVVPSPPPETPLVLEVLS
jgi:thymidine phosphorylase